MNTLKFYYLFYPLFDMTVPKSVESKLYTERIKPELKSLAFLGKKVFVTNIFCSYLYQTDMEIVKKKYHRISFFTSTDILQERVRNPYKYYKYKIIKVYIFLAWRERENIFL